MKSNKEESCLDCNKEYKPKILWPDLLAQIYVHFGGLYGLYLVFTNQCRVLTLIWAFVTMYASGFGITAGAHRLWSHKAYKATWQLRLLLVLLFTITGQRHVWAWALDHRVHHKYSETTSDPHDANRGFFFAHVGWLFLTPHPDVVEKREKVDMSDLEADAIVMWQKKYYIPLFALLTVVIPVLVPWYFWQELLWNSLWVNFNARFSITLNIAFCVNSVSHMWGMKPYDKHINPVENLGVSLAALGEGWHNYHHVFPWDYKTGELGKLNLSTYLIDLFAKIGWAYDLKSVSKETLKMRILRCGDGSHHQTWGDMNMNDKEVEENEKIE